MGRGPASNQVQLGLHERPPRLHRFAADDLCRRDNVGSDSIPAWQQAAGVWMLVHEAFHLRHWRFRRNEAKVGCQTIVYFTDAAARSGASESQAQQLYPYALALHYLELDLYPWHRDPDCIVPPWILPSAP